MGKKNATYAAEFKLKDDMWLTKMDSKPLHDNLMYIQNVYAHAAIKRIVLSKITL
jgi:hypothetical protein